MFHMNATRPVKPGIFPVFKVVRSQEASGERPSSSLDSPTIKDQERKILYYEVREQLFKAFMGIGAVIGALSFVGAKRWLDIEVQEVKEKAVQVDSARARAIRAADSARSQVNSLHIAVSDLQTQLSMYRGDAENMRRASENAAVYASAAGIRAGAIALNTDSARAEMERRVRTSTDVASGTLSKSLTEITHVRDSANAVLSEARSSLGLIATRVGRVESVADSLTNTWAIQLEQKGSPHLVPGTGLAISCGEIWRKGKLEQFLVMDVATKRELYRGDLLNGKGVRVTAPGTGTAYAFAVTEIYDGSGLRHERDDRATVRVSRLRL
jgi:hypothetical protein